MAIGAVIAPYTDGSKLKQRVAKPMSVTEVRLLLTGKPSELDEDKRPDDRSK